MSAVVECPACHESLELPDEFIEGVVCPHCEAAFILKPVLLNDAGEPIEEQPAGSAAPSVLPPPESAASEANQEAAPAPASEVASEGDVTSEGEAPSEASASSSGLRFAALAAAGDSGSKDEGNIAVAAAGAEAAAAASESKTADAEQETKADSKSDKAKSDDADSDSPWANLGQADSGKTESSASKASMSAKAVRQRKNQGPSMLSLSIGVVISGFVGLYLGYWLLNFFGGPRFHFLDLPLPFVDHSASSRGDSDDYPSPPPGGGPITIEGPRSKQPPRRNRRPANDRQGQLTPAAELPTVAAQPPAEPQPQQGAMPSFSSQELADALTEANRATSAPGGDVPLTAELYEQLCRLAHVATFVDANEPQVLARREAVHTVLRRITHRPQQLAAVNALAQARLATAAVATDPLPNPGIVLAGQVVGSTSSGPWQLTRVQLLHAAQASPARPVPGPAPSNTPLESQLPGSTPTVASPVVAQAVHRPQATLVQSPPAEAPAAVTLVSTGRIPLQPGASRLFVGSLVVQPRQALPGYTVDDSPVVWAGTWVTFASDAS